MAKLYFKYGAMGSSKTAQALMCKYNYEQKGFKVFLFEQKSDNRFVENGRAKVWTRIGLSADCFEFDASDNFFDLCEKLDILHEKRVIIIDECQFLTKAQVDQLKDISLQVPVLCYGLLTNFKTELFEGSKRLVEIADSLMEIKCVCSCGRKAIVNARLVDGRIVTSGDEIAIGGDESYESMCYTCYKNKVLAQKTE